MDTDRLLEKLRKLYILTMDYEFHKSSYAKYMDSLRSNYADLLQEAADQTGADTSVANEASEGIAVLAGYTMKEAQIENLVTAKGYADCVAFISDESVSVVVSAQEGGLTDADVAKITEIVTDETGYEASQVKIIEAQE